VSAIACGLALLTAAHAFGAAVAPTSPDEDVVETIPAEGATGPRSDATRAQPPAPPPITPAPPSNALGASDAYQVSAWAVEELHLTLGRASMVPPYLAVPLDRAASRTHAFAHFRYSHDSWLEIDASTAISYGYFVEGLAGTVQGDADHHASRGAFEPSARELYVGLFGSKIDLRLGQQRVAWGRADAQSPNDVLNARDLRDPFQPEPDLSQIPTPLARLDWIPGALGFEAVWAPFFVPDQFDVYGSNWAIVEEDAPQGLRGFFRTMSSLVDSSLVDPYNRLIQQTKLPSPIAANMSGGLKVSATVGDVDFDAYYHYGFDRTPLLRIDPAFEESLDRTNFSQAKASDFGPLFSLIQAGESPITNEYIHRHHVGFDAGTVIGPIGLTVDVGYDSQRVFFQRDVTGVVSPAVEGVASLEFQTGDARKVFLIEGSALRIVDDVRSLLFVDRTTLSATGVVRYPLFGPFDAEVRAVASAVPRSAILRPQIGWRATDHLAVHVGGLWLAGDEWSLGNYFRRNTEIFADAKYSL
jgi:hypothetical protein